MSPKDRAISEKILDELERWLNGDNPGRDRAYMIRQVRRLRIILANEE